MKIVVVVGSPFFAFQFGTGSWELCVFIFGDSMGGTTDSKWAVPQIATCLFFAVVDWSSRYGTILEVSPMLLLGTFGRREMDKLLKLRSHQFS